MVTADTKGRFKMWDISACNFREQTSHAEIRSKIRMCWYIQAHRSAVNTIQIVETFKDEVDLFIVSAGADMNILLHKMSNGARVGQFSQEASWNIRQLNDKASRRKMRPRYVPDWFKSKKDAWTNFVQEKITKARNEGLI